MLIGWFPIIGFSTQFEPEPVAYGQNAHASAINAAVFQPI
jgi:hypothetical protein